MGWWWQRRPGDAVGQRDAGLASGEGEAAGEVGQIRGEGVIGLPHAFLSAGARGVIVTLWRIGDRSAAEFIPAFYAELRGGASPARALLAIRQRWLAAGGPNAHPSRWAPFILVGGGGVESARPPDPP